MTDQTFTDIAGNVIRPGDRIVITRKCIGSVHVNMGTFLGMHKNGGAKVELEEKVGGVVMPDGSPLPADFWKPWLDFPMPKAAWQSGLTYGTPEYAAVQAEWLAASTKKQEKNKELLALTIPNPALKYRNTTLQLNMIVKVQS